MPRKSAAVRRADVEKRLIEEFRQNEEVDLMEFTGRNGLDYADVKAAANKLVDRGWINPCEEV